MFLAEGDAGHMVSMDGKERIDMKNMKSVAIVMSAGVACHALVAARRSPR